MKLTEKQSEQLNALLDSGKAICRGEYRLCEAGERGFMSAATGKRETYSGIWHTIEVGNKSILVSDAADTANLDVEKYKSPFKKGEIVLVHLESHGYSKGKGERYRGTIIKVES
jgi:hypothetical protein